MGDSKDAKVTYRQSSIISVLRDLEMMVVSLDRLGSYEGAAKDDADHNRLLADFVTDWDVFRKLAEARAVLSEPFDDHVGADGMDLLERTMGDVKYWSREEQQPPQETADNSE